MRWIQLATLFVACSQAACLAEMPDFSGSRPQAMQLFQGRLLGGQGWWSRYGEPVNTAAMNEAQTQAPDKNAPAMAMPAYGDGYVYTPGACDCPPPCIWHLWNGYFQFPKRCRGPHWGAGGACGNGCNGACAGNDGCGCGAGRGMLSKIFCHSGCGNCGGCDSCSTASSCASCASPVSCSTAACDCGCKPVCCKCRTCHLGDRWRCFMAHWNCGGCDSCSCSCAAPACDGNGPSPAITPPSEKQASQGPPVPLPEEALLHPLPRLN